MNLHTLALAAVLTGATPVTAAPQPETLQPLRYQLRIEPDMEKRRFDARIVADFEVSRPTKSIVLDSAELDIHEAELDGQHAVTPSQDAARQRVSFDLPGDLKPGRHSLRLDYSGPIRDSGSGLLRFARGAEPHDVLLHAALCCSARTRFLAPLWDQPQYKAAFELQLIVPADQDVVANMPVVARQPLEAGQVRIDFAPTPPMTPSLFYFAIGRFSRLGETIQGTPIGVVATPNVTDKAQFTVAATGEAIAYLGDYLGIRYPLPKLDSVVLPGAPGGAISNWGAIQYGERYLIVGEPWSTQDELFTTFAMVAHEVSHQWFGNLVTPRHRGHAWLSEGFATWMENKITDAVHPNWDTWLRTSEHREAALRMDAKSSAHPVARDVVDAAARPSDSEIIYDKSAQILRMLAVYAGEEKFQAAIRAFVNQHAYGTVESEDLWRALDRQLPGQMGHIGRDFTQQIGVPLIEVLSAHCLRGSTTLTLRQSRFALDDVSRAPRTWRVPVSAMSLSARKVRYRLVEGSKPVALKVPGCGPVKVNVDHVGYFRTLYDSETLEALQAAAAQLSPADRQGLLRDQQALAEGESSSPH